MKVQINKYNFLRWFTLADSILQPAIPWLYWKDRDRLSCPIAYPSEAMSFYINTIDSAGLDYPGFANLKIRLINAKTGAVTNGDIGTLERQYLDPPDNTIYNPFSTFDFPAAADGFYYLQIYDTVEADVILNSSLIHVMNDKQALDLCSCYFRFRNDRFYYGINYADIPDFFQQFRLLSGITESVMEGDTEQYKEVTTGKTRILEDYVNNVVKLETYWFDQEQHLAAGLMFNHSYVEINGSEYRRKATYKQQSGGSQSAVSKGEIELLDMDFASANRC